MQRDRGGNPRKDRKPRIDRRKEHDVDRRARDYPVEPEDIRNSATPTGYRRIGNGATDGHDRCLDAGAQHARFRWPVDEELEGVTPGSGEHRRQQAAREAAEAAAVPPACRVDSDAHGRYSRPRHGVCAPHRIHLSVRRSNSKVSIGCTAGPVLPRFSMLSCGGMTRPTAGAASRERSR